MQKVRLEIVAENADAVLGAWRGGAERIELCASLADGGLTPSLGFIEWTLGAVSVPVHCMLRPRAGNFCYSREELAVMAGDLRRMRAAGAHGVVMGVLTRDGRVDRDAMRRLVEASGAMRVCFHRAFDLAADREQALEEIIGCGAEILLTSGGAKSLEAGAAEVERIAKQAGGRIEVMGGAGVNRGNAGELWRRLPIDTLHASLRSPWRSPWQAAGAESRSTARMGVRDEEPLYTVRAEDVRAVLEEMGALRSGVEVGSVGSALMLG